MAQCATTALAGAVPRPCVRGDRGRLGGLGPVPGGVSLPFPPSRPACPALLVAGRPVRVSLTLARWYGLVALLVVPACPLPVCALALPRRPLFPTPRVVWCAHLARSRHWALVGPFHLVRAPPRVLPRSLALSGVLWGGAVRSRFPPTWLGLHALWGLRAAGVAGGRPRGGGGLPLLGGASGVRRRPSPDRPSSGAGSRGTATRVFRVRSVWAWGPSTGSTACAPAGRRCSLWGWREGVPGGDAFHRCEGRLRSGAPPPPTACPLGGLSGSATNVLWARVCGCGGLTLSPWPACPVGAACRGGGGGPSRGGVAYHRCEGRLVSGAVPPPAARPLGRAAGVPRPVCPGCGGCRRGNPAPAPQRAPLRAGVAHCGGGGRAFPGGCLPPL